MGIYYEPFLGGGAVFLSLANDKRFSGAVVNDVNKELMDTWRVVRDFPEDLIRALQAMPHSPEEFQRLRALQPDELEPIDRAARMIYLNKTSYNGLYRVNMKGGFNAPFGRYEKPNICNQENLRLLSDVLSRTPVTFHHIDFEDVCRGAREGDVVYFDPPYLPASSTANFTGYTKWGFRMEEHQRLATLFRTLVKKGVHCVASNAGVDEARALYEGFEIHEVRARRAINSKADRRGHISEIVIVGRP
jgi:DNA adenine methylase